MVGWGVLAATYSRSFPKSMDFYLILILFFVLFSSFVNYRETQWMSTMYSVFFILSYYFYSGFIRSYFTVGDYSRALEFIFVLYFFGLLAGQLYVNVLGFSPLYVSGTVVLGRMGASLEAGQFRYYSFSSEPSYAAFIVITLYYSFTRINGNQSLFRGINLVFFLMLLYMLFFFRSAYAALLLGLLLMSFLGFTKRFLLVYFLIFFLGLVILSFVNEVPGAARLINIVNNLDLENPHNLSIIDFNTYYRVAPLLHYFRIFDWQDLHFWIGYGAAASRHLVVPEIYLASQGEFLGGFVPSFFYDYGVLGGVMVLFFAFRQVPSFFSFPTAVIGLMLLNANFNTQLFWLLILCFSIDKHFSKQAKQEEAVVVKSLT